MSPRNSIRNFRNNIDYSPFFVGSIVDLTKHVDMNDRSIAVLEATGLWVITDFTLRQEATINRYRPNMWTELCLNADQTYMQINIALEWVPYAYPQEYVPAWEVPSDFNGMFEVGKQWYMMSSILSDYGSDGKHKYEIHIHPLVKLHYAEEEFKNNSQSNRTIEQ